MMKSTHYLLCMLFLILMVGVVSADVLVVYAEYDGRMYRNGVDEAFSTIRNASGVGGGQVVNLSSTITASGTTNKYQTLVRAGFTFNTTTIPSDATINSVIVSFYGIEKVDTLSLAPSLRLVKYSPENALSYGSGDYASTKWGETPNQIADAITYTNFSVGGYNNFTLTDLTAINKSGYTTIGTRTGSDYANSIASWSSQKTAYFIIASVSNSGASKDPYITITWTAAAGDTTPPASITGLTNDTVTDTTANFHFTIPEDADYNHLHVYKDGTSFHNINSPTNYDNWTGLLPNTTYQFSARTVDNSSNENLTWTNITFTTNVASLKTWPKIMISIDDGSYLTNTNAYPILSAYGFKATANVISSIAANSDWQNFTDLYNNGWDIANHGRYHVLLTGCSTAEQEANILGGQQDLIARGLIRGAYHYVYPFGDYDANVMASAQAVGSLTGRSVNIDTLTIPCVSLFDLPVTVYVVNTTTVETVETAISTGTTNQTIVILLHNIRNFSGYQYDWPPSYLDQLSLWLHNNGYQTITISEWYALNGGVVPSPPVASFTKNQTSGLQPLIVQFTDTSSDSPTVWNWSFGDGAWQNGTTQNATHTYSTGGAYPAFLISSNAYGSNQSASQTINIYNQTSGTTITPSPASGQTNTAIPLTPSGVNVSANGYSWYFPNGSSIINTTSAPINFIGTVDGGTYSVQLTTTDNGWGASSVNVTVTTEDNTAANFTANITSGLTPLPVLFTDSSTHIPIRFNWSFGDGSPWVNGTDPTPTHIYATGGEYTVILVASNLLSTDTKTRTNYIEVWNRTGIASFNADIVTGDAPLSVTFTDVSYNATNWYTEFGDGNTSTTKSPAFIYNIPGFYTVNHRAYNAHDSAWLNQTNYITVTTPIPIAAFSGVPTTGDAPLSVTFTDASTNSPTSWYWEFGDGNISTAQNPSNNYGTPGLYSVNLKATNAGGSDWENKTDYINVTSAPYVPTPPVAAFSGVPTSGSAPLFVTFTDASTNTPISWYWEFGDGNTSTLKNPTNTYGTPGTYSVNLRATNADGFDWENKTNYITANVPPTPTPTPTPIPMTPNLNRDARITDPLTWIKNWFNDIRRIER